MDVPRVLNDQLASKGLLRIVVLEEQLDLGAASLLVDNFVE
jgi:hypothetical protein